MPTTAGQKKQPDLDGGTNAQAVASARLRSVIERIEHIEEEKKSLSEDIKEIYVEAKGTGLDVTTIRTLVRWRKKDKAQREAQAALLELYSNAIGEVGVFG
jgi:uncharacterized protein (UPF0335 family)